MKRTLKTDNMEALKILKDIKTSINTQTLELCWSIKTVEGLKEITLDYKKPSSDKEKTFVNNLLERLSETQTLIYDEVDNVKYKETQNGNVVLDRIGEEHYLLCLETENGKKNEVLGNYFYYDRAVEKFNEAVEEYAA